MKYKAVSAALIVVGVFVGWGLQHRYHADLGSLPAVAAGVSPFALLYVMAGNCSGLSRRGSLILA